MTLPTLAELEQEEPGLLLPAFNESVALALGQKIVELALARKAPVVVNIRSSHRTYFHAALPGSEANNDNWARRKSNLALMMGKASMFVTLRMAAKGRTLAGEGLAEGDYAASGGAVPLKVAGGGMVAVATVSGLPQEEDHRLVAEAILALKG